MPPSSQNKAYDAISNQTAPQIRFVQIESRDPISSKPEDIPEMKTIAVATEDATGTVLQLIERTGGISAQLTGMIAEVRASITSGSYCYSCRI